MAVSFASAQQLPDVKVETAQGKIISVRNLSQGKPLIIAYWSIACKPCIQELNAINDSLAEWRSETDVDVIAVSVDDARSLQRPVFFTWTVSVRPWSCTVAIKRFGREINDAVTVEGYFI